MGRFGHVVHSRASQAVTGRDVAVARTREILERVNGRPGHIFNLGHGVLPDTDPAVLRAVVETVHSF